ISYLDVEPWPLAADGDGYSVVLNNRDDPSGGENWSQSGTVGGSPGRSENSDPGDGFVGDPTGDDDSDGYPNFVEYALGSPWETDGEMGFPLIQANRSDTGELTVRFPINPEATDGRVIPELSFDLLDWRSGDAVLILVEELDSHRVYHSVEPLGDEDTAFIRLRVEQIE